MYLPLKLKSHTWCYLAIAAIALSTSGCARVYHAVHYNCVSRILHEKPATYYHSEQTGRIIPKDCCPIRGELPCYGYEPTCWHQWPADCQKCPLDGECSNGMIMQEQIISEGVIINESVVPSVAQPVTEPIESPSPDAPDAGDDADLDDPTELLDQPIFDGASTFERPTRAIDYDAPLPVEDVLPIDDVSTAEIEDAEPTVAELPVAVETLSVDALDEQDSVATEIPAVDAEPSVASEAVVAESVDEFAALILAPPTEDSTELVVEEIEPKAVKTPKMDVPTASIGSHRSLVAEPNSVTASKTVRNMATVADIVNEVTTESVPVDSVDVPEPTDSAKTVTPRASVLKVVPEASPKPRVTSVSMKSAAQETIVAKKAVPTFRIMTKSVVETEESLPLGVSSTINFAAERNERLGNVVRPEGTSQLKFRR